MNMTDKTEGGAQNERTMQLEYPVHTLEDGRTVCGRSLARELVEDALKLLVPMHKGSVDGAWQELWELAAPVARRLDDEAKAGGKPGLVLMLHTRH